MFLTRPESNRPITKLNFTPNEKKVQMMFLLTRKRKYCIFKKRSEGKKSNTGIRGAYGKYIRHSALNDKKRVATNYIILHFYLIQRFLLFRKLV